jgi:kynurenine formamidase
MKGKSLSLFILFFAACTGKQSNQNAEGFSNGKWIDLSYSFSKETLYWPNNPTGFVMDTFFAGFAPGGYYYSSYGFCAPEHGGTHLDAPVHFAEGRKAVDELSLDQLTGNALVIDVSPKALNNRDYLISIDDVQQWEKTNGSLADSVILLFRTGYGKFYPDANKYFGTDKKGDSAIALLHFPGIDPQLAEWLVKNKKIKAVGIDTPSIDYGQSSDFKTHRILLAENIPAFENVANMNELPVKGSYIVALPMQIKGGSGAPLRMIAFDPG